MPSRTRLHFRAWNGPTAAETIEPGPFSNESTPTCLFLHGLGEGGYIFEPVIPSLGHRGACIVPDLMGHGDSAWDDSGRYDVTDHAGDVDALCRTLGVGPLILIGHSLGGAVALHLAARGHLDIRGVALIDYAPEMDVAILRQLLAALTSEDRGYATPEAYRALLAVSRPLAEDPILDHIASSAIRQSPDGRYRLKRDGRMIERYEAALSSESFGAGGPAMWSALATLDCPLLVIRGAASAMLTMPVARKIERVAFDVSVQTVANAGHAVVTDNPRGFADALRPFLADCS